MNQEQPDLASESTSRLETIGQLRAHIVDLMPDAETLWQAGGGAQGNAMRRTRRGLRATENPPTFRGHLVIDAELAYPTLRERFATLGYTPLLHKEGNYDLIAALPYVFPNQASKSGSSRWVINLVLLIATVVTTTLAGALNENIEQLAQNPMLFFQQPWLILTGLPASMTIMSILGIHELGHYFMSRRHGLPTTLPFFIPFLPVPGGFGTFGAVIRAQAPWENRKALFDVGLAGPLAGLVIALPIFFVGLMTSPHQPHIPGSMSLGSPPLLQWMENAVYALRGIPEDHEIYANAMTYAAWFGLFVTGVNLLPAGQFDGGHVAYAVLGRWARLMSMLVLGMLVVLGTMYWRGWYIWAAMVFSFGWQHPAPLNTVAPLGKRRIVVGFLALVLTILLFTPAPLPF
jgi:membrane-associated protease RseP (regulator of RpoE activity)